jgi:hypothetical protein
MSKWTILGPVMITERSPQSPYEFDAVSMQVALLAGAMYRPLGAPRLL